MKRLALLLVLFALPVRAPARESNTPSLAAFSTSIEDIAVRVGRSVVQINGASVGSGVILSPDGYIITNAHVIDGSRTLTVALPGNSDSFETDATARVIGVDQETDLAVLKIEKDNLPYLEIADAEEIRQGQIVLAFGSPLGLSNSMTMGIVSATNRDIDANHPVGYVQTDAPINPGSSGGALVDTNGHLLGINTFILSQSGGNEGIGFAIPARVVRNVYQQLREHGRVRRGVIGAASQNLTDVLVEGLALASRSGVLVCDVAPGGPADRAGLKVGDVVLAVDGTPLRTSRQLQAQVFNAAEGQWLKLDVLHGDRRSTIDVAVETRKEMPDGIEIEQLGVLALDADGGVLVSDRTSTPAQPGLDLAAGDVIQAVNNSTVASVEDLRQRLTSVTSGAPVVLLVQRDGGLRYVGFRLE